MAKAVFDALMTALVGRLIALPGELNAWSTQANSTLSTLSSQTRSAQQQVNLASEQLRVLSEAASPAAYSTTAAYNVNSTVIAYDGRLYRCLVNGTTGVEPSTSDTYSPGVWLCLDADEWLELAAALCGLLPGWSLSIGGASGVENLTWTNGLRSYKADLTWTQVDDVQCITRILLYKKGGTSAWTTILPQNELELSYDSFGRWRRLIWKPESGQEVITWIGDNGPTVWDNGSVTWVF
jgi:hypothetical protein